MSFKLHIADYNTSKIGILNANYSTTLYTIENELEYKILSSCSPLAAFHQFEQNFIQFSSSTTISDCEKVFFFIFCFHIRLGNYRAHNVYRIYNSIKERLRSIISRHYTSNTTTLDDYRAYYMQLHSLLKQKQ